MSHALKTVTDTAAGHKTQNRNERIREVFLAHDYIYHAKYHNGGKGCKKQRSPAPDGKGGAIVLDMKEIKHTRNKRSP